MRNSILLRLSVLLFVSAIADAQVGPVGIFTSHGDVGIGVKPGSAVYITESQQYIISGSGANVWADHDEFQYVWKKIKGDFILYTRAEFLGSWVNYHRKIGWMVRKSLDGNSAHVNAVEHGDGLTSLQFRREAGAQTEEIKSKLVKANILQLERRGNQYIMRVAVYGENFVTDTLSNINLGDEVYVGLFVGSHNADVLETGVFSDTRITIPFKGDADGHTNMTLGSNLEVVDLASGKREILYSKPYSIQAPNWKVDGKGLVFNDYKGVMYDFNLATRTPSPINTGRVKNNNNDHVLSFDGKMIGLSNSENGRGSIVFTVPIDGGEPKQITPTGPSYLHGWSPDGKWLVFCGDRNGEFDVYRIPASGGEEVRLTNAPGLDDGPEYSPDGKYIYFNSVRSGSMQIWRMKPDGKDQEQVTDDEYNNWFAHVSPDGKSICFLSFLPSEAPPGSHPPYKHVCLRWKSLDGGGKIKTIAYFYGGQGSMNTPSWSPDSKRIAFISNTDMSGNP